MTEITNKDKLLTASEASEYLNIDKGTLTQWRFITKSSGKLKGPAFHRLEGAIRYRISDLDAFIEQGKTAA